MVKKLKAICPHCQTPIQIIAEDEVKPDSWLVYTPLPIERSDIEPGPGED
jgi:hypothetical protein